MDGVIVDYSDAGNAAAFHSQYAGIIAYTDSLGWIWWNGHNWEPNEHQAVEHAVKFTADLLCDAADLLSIALHHEADAKLAVEEKQDGAKDCLEKAKKEVADAKAYHRHALRSRNEPRIKGMLKLAEPPFWIKAEQLDADPFILNTPDGIVNLKTGELKSSQLDAMSAPLCWCTHVTAVSPGNAGADMWQDFLQTITCGDGALAGFLQMVAGMAAVGKVFHEGIIIACGSGRNGKSTFFNALAAALGDYAGTIDVQTLTTDRQNKGPALATLRGKRLVIASELEEGKRLSTSTLKQIASTDKLTIEQKFKQPETISQTHTLILHTNHLPRVGSTDNGTWRRLTVVPFNAVIPTTGATQNYGEELAKKAAPAILSWIIQGAVNFVRDGYKLTIPDAVEMATEEYRDHENWLDNFISERCVRESGARAGARDLYLDYRSWAEENGEYVRRENDFSAALETAGYLKIKPQNRKTWVGLRLVTAKY